MLLLQIDDPWWRQYQRPSKCNSPISSTRKSLSEFFPVKHSVRNLPLTKKRFSETFRHTLWEASWRNREKRFWEKLSNFEFSKFERFSVRGSPETLQSEVGGWDYWSRLVMLVIEVDDRGFWSRLLVEAVGRDWWSRLVVEAVVGRK